MAEVEVFRIFFSPIEVQGPASSVLENVSLE